MNYFDLMRSHQGYLERIALAMLGNRADAEDAMQEAALAGYQNFRQLRGGEQAFGAWMRQILIHKSRRILDYRQRILPVDDMGSYLPEAAPGPDPESTALWEMVARLSDHLRPVVVLRSMPQFVDLEYWQGDRFRLLAEASGGCQAYRTPRHPVRPAGRRPVGIRASA